MKFHSPYTQRDLDIDINLTPAQKSTIQSALNAGAEVMLHQTGFDDPGDDYSTITVDGVEVARIEGY